MDVTLLVALGSVILLLIISVALFFKKSDKPKADDRPRPGPNRAREGVPRRAQLARNRGARLRANAPQEQPPSDDELNQNEGQREIEVPDGAKIGAKKKAKLEAKAEKKAQREAEEQSRAERKKKEQLADEERKKAEAKREAEEKRREEEERKAKEEKERREHEEYLKMKEAFSVEEEGFEEGEEGNEMNLLQEFVAYIKNNKVVVIEDLAAHFKLKTQAAIDRIRDLQKDDILTGVIDDRGKFIYAKGASLDCGTRRK
ncbi:hypothetical protein TcasGA2_TC001171 [Tribolium castaneum]|uniref:DDRGK domain-containing protein 1 n=1 Tax=Tribolium castaneum TaxID=7070 RepID=D6WAK5_TRICA|nr:hypothetical protein TcasGA2_TC001171 [Tribolium castaneum]